MNTFITLLLSLSAIHFILDFYCQPASWIEDKIEKKRKSKKLLLHSLLHGAVASFPVLLISPSWGAVSTVFIAIAGSHWVIDLANVYAGSRLRYFILNQLLHLSVILLAALWLSRVDIAIIVLLNNILSVESLVVMLGYIIILKPSSVLIGQVLKRYTPEAAPENSGLLAGGEMIGYLERALIFTFILLNQYSVVGFILAAKSIFRFGELNNSQKYNLTEYVLLGSLLSVTMTALAGILVKHLAGF